MSYKNDHIKVLKTLGADLPKRPSMKTSDIASKGFKGQEDADRRVRNAYRMLRKYNHIEIGERGEYKITQSGASLYDKLEKNGWKVPESEKPKRAAPAKKTAKKATKKATKKPVKKAAKKVTKAKPAAKAKAKAKPAAKAKPVSKAKAKGKMPSTGKKESKPASKKEPVKVESKSNGTPPAKSEPKASSSQLAF